MDEYHRQLEQTLELLQRLPQDYLNSAGLLRALREQLAQNKIPDLDDRVTEATNMSTQTDPLQTRDQGTQTEEEP